MSIMIKKPKQKKTKTRPEHKNNIMVLVWCVWMKGRIEFITWLQITAFYEAAKCTVIDLTPLLQRLILTRSDQEHVAAKKQQDHGVDQNKQTSHVSVVVVVPSQMKTQTFYAWRATKFQQFISKQYVAVPLMNQRMRYSLAGSGSCWSINR